LTKEAAPGTAICGLTFVPIDVPVLWFEPSVRTQSIPLCGACNVGG
jgi:hypothetical protein